MWKLFRKSAPSTFSKRKVLYKNKNPLIQDKYDLIWIYLVRNSKNLFSYLKWAPSIFQIKQFSAKIKTFKFAIQNALFGCFGLAIWKNHCHIWNHSISNHFSKGKISFENKNPWICDLKCLIWVFSGCNIEKLFSYLKSESSNLSKMNF